MEKEYFDRTLAALRSRVPFQPFTVVLTSGDRVEIDHSDAMIHRAGRAAVLGPGGSVHLFDWRGVSQIVDDLMPQKAD